MNKEVALEGNNITDSGNIDITFKEILDNINSVQSLYKEYVDRIESYKDIIDANYPLNVQEGRSKIRPKVVKALHNYSYAALSEGLLSDYTIVDVTPRGSDDKESSDAQKLLLNYQLNEEMDFSSVVDKASMYFEDFGSFYLKLSWNYKERKEKAHKVEYKELPDTITQEQFQQLQSQGLISEDGLLIIDKPVTKVVEDHPVISLKKYNQIILGPSLDGSNTIDSLEFIADRYYSTIADLENVGEYENLDKIYDTGSVSDYDINALPDSEFNAELDNLMENSDYIGEKIDKHKPLVVTEYWTRRQVGKQKKVVLITFVSGVIIKKEFSPYGEAVGYPFARGVYYQSIDDELYDGIPDTEELADSQKVIGAVTRGTIDIMARHANGRVGIAEGFLDVAEERKFEAREDFKFNPALHPSNAIWEEKFPELPGSILQLLQMSQSNMESISGKKLFGEGLSSASYGDVAAGVKAVTNATDQRMMSNIRKFNKPFIDIIKKMAELNKKFITDDKIIALSDGSFHTVNPDSLDADISIKISVSTPEMDDKKANDIAFLIQTLGDSVDYKTKQLMLSEVARLKKRPDLAQALLDVPEPQPSQQELELHQLQVELLKAQIENEYAKAQENQTDAVLNQAKAQTEGAKAGVLDSTRDKQDLDFLHKKNGVDLEREKELADKHHVDSMEKATMDHILKLKEGEHGAKLENKSPKKTDKTKVSDIPVIDMPSESIQANDLTR
jgi:hypothetical protein